MTIITVKEVKTIEVDIEKTICDCCKKEIKDRVENQYILSICQIQKDLNGSLFSKELINLNDLCQTCNDSIKVFSNEITNSILRNKNLYK